MTLKVEMNSLTSVCAGTFLSAGEYHSLIMFYSGEGEIMLRFSGADVWKAQALADAFNSPAPKVPA